IYLALALKLATAGRAGTARQADSSYHRAQAARAPLGDAAHLRQSFEQGYETAQPLANGSRRVAGKAEADTVLAVVTAGHSRWIKGLSGQQRHPHAAGCRGQHAGTPPRRQAAPQVEATARARGDLETGRGWAQPRQHGRAPLGIGCAYVPKMAIVVARGQKPYQRDLRQGPRIQVGELLGQGEPSDDR